MDVTRDDVLKPQLLYPRSMLPHVGQCDCDCACSPETLVAVPAPEVSEGVWSAVPVGLSEAVDANWQAVVNPAGPVVVCVLNQPMRALWRAFAPPASLSSVLEQTEVMHRETWRQAIAELARAGLIRPVPNRMVETKHRSMLSVWLHVTDACNLNCPYCYVEKRGLAMSPEQAAGLVARLLSLAEAHGYAAVQLKYAGGEPFLNQGAVRAAHEKAVRLSRRAGVKLHEVILTNGTLISDEALNFAAQEGVRLMISLDGGPAAHDSVRVSVDGNGTYQRIIETIERAIGHGLLPELSVTLTTLNLREIDLAADLALRYGLPFNLNFYRERLPPAVKRLEGTFYARRSGAREAGVVSTIPANQMLMPSAGELIDALKAVFRVIASYPAYQFPLTGILDRLRLDVPHERPCSAGHDYLVVNQQGQISPCQMLLGFPWSSLSSDDPLGEIREQGAEVFLPVQARPVCRDCSWRTICAGGCPLLWGTEVHDRYCQVYRAVLPELVKLEAQRLIGAKTASLPRSTTPHTGHMDRCTKNTPEATRTPAPGSGGRCSIL